MVFRTERTINVITDASMRLLDMARDSCITATTEDEFVKSEITTLSCQAMMRNIEDFMDGTINAGEFINTRCDINDFFSKAYSDLSKGNT